MPEIRGTVLYGVVDTVRFRCLQGQLEKLLLRGLDKATLSIAIETIGTEVVVEKLIESENNIVLEISIYGEDGVSLPVDEIKIHAQKMAFSVRIGGKENYRVQGGYRICCGSDIEKIHKFLGFVFFDALGLKKDERFSIRIDKVSPWPEVISSPSQLPASRRAAIDLLKREAREKHGIGTISSILLLLFAACHWGGVIGLTIVLFLLRDQAEWFSVSILENLLQIPVAGGLFILAIGFGIIGTMAVFLGTYWSVPIGTDIRGFLLATRHIIGKVANFWSRPPIWGSILLIVVSVVVWNFVDVSR